jgi:prophage tail gpP-like protein
MNDEITLKVRGQLFTNWTAVMLEKSMYQMVGSFGLATTDLYPAEAKKWNIALGDECIVEINNQKVITGYIEDVQIDYDAGTHNIQFKGRDKTGDLVDCSYNEKLKEFQGLSVKKIIEKMCLPFNIDVVVDSSVTSEANSILPGSFKVNEGDTVFDLIMAICHMKAILPVSYGDGKLTLTQTGIKYKTNDILVSGKNILKGSFIQSNKDRFETYIIKGNDTGADTKSISDFSSAVGAFTDKAITRYRPITIFAETKCDRSSCLKRAEWEMNKRAGSSRILEYEVQGWTQSNGKLWPLNAMVQVKDAILGINETLLISALFFTVNESGSVTKLKVVHPKAFSTLPTLPAVKGGFDWMKGRT